MHSRIRMWSRMCVWVWLISAFVSRDHNVLPGYAIKLPSGRWADWVDQSISWSDRLLGLSTVLIWRHYVRQELFPPSSVLWYVHDPQPRHNPSPRLHLQNDRLRANALTYRHASCILLSNVWNFKWRARRKTIQWCHPAKNAPVAPSSLSSSSIWR